MKNFQRILAIAVFLSGLCLENSLAQLSGPDEIKTSKGPLIIQPIQHGSLVLAWNSKTIYVDPYGGGKYFKGIAAPDMIIITDIHGDHMSLETLGAIETSKATLVVPKAVADQLPEQLRKQCVIINNGEEITRLGVGIKAIPMYNLPETPESRHPKGFWEKKMFIYPVTRKIFLR